MPLNDWFSGRYTLARQELEARLTAAPDPLIIRVGPELMYWHHGRRRTARLMTDPYERAKAVSHAPAAIFLALRGRVGVALTADELSVLRDLDRDLLDEQTEDDSMAAQRMLAGCHDFLAGVITEESVGVDAMSAFAAAVLEPMSSLIHEGTRAYLEALHDTVSEWTERWDEQTWARLLVVICAGHAPRYKESTRTYFTRLLGETHGLGARGEAQVVYAEAIDSEDDAIRLAGEHLLNRELGRFFMNSSVALQEDVLGDATRVILDEVLQSRSP